MPDPDLLILDEPTVGMDVEIRRSFWASMRDFTATGRTVLFATHYLDEADAVADRIVVLTDGRVVADGSGAQIKSRVAGRTIAVATAGLDRAAVAALRRGAEYRGSSAPACWCTPPTPTPRCAACSGPSRRPGTSK